jgi:L-seryl-tRNA(Ser) seleniumtransferase
MEPTLMRRRDLPSVDRILRGDEAQDWIREYGRTLTTLAIRQQLNTTREAIRAGEEGIGEMDLLNGVNALLREWTSASLRRVINATGVILHTNLGRAPLSRAAQEAVLQVGREYSTLEFDLEQGARGERERHCDHALRLLTGAESSLVVNNNASAVLLVLTALAKGKQVLISRTQLIEIGGGFRIPEVLDQSGAHLIEVGTTNRTHLRDFQAALGEETALILRAHHSNFKIIGFTTEPSLEELVSVGKQAEIPVLDDLGSGALLDTEAFGLGHEFMVQESLEAGAALVCFSGDKLLGGPQAGIILGQEPLVAQLRRHPLARALRPDKLCLAALQATLVHYLREEAEDQIPIWQMIGASEAKLHARALDWQEKLGRGEVLESRSTVGGGSLPEETLPTWVLGLEHDHPDQLSAHLRGTDPPVITRIEADRVLLDPRTVLPEQEEHLLRVLRDLA